MNIRKATIVARTTLINLNARNTFSTQGEDLTKLDDVSLNRSLLSSLDGNVLNKCIVSDKRFFTFNNFIVDHPDSLITNFSQLRYILAEKGSLKQWAVELNSKWELLNATPDWLINNEELRTKWLQEYQGELISIRLKEIEIADAINKARATYESAVATNNRELQDFQDNVYKNNPVLLIHLITPSALSESDLIRLHSLPKAERKIQRKLLLNEYKISLLQEYHEKKLTPEKLIERVKTE